MRLSLAFACAGLMALFPAGTLGAQASPAHPTVSWSAAGLGKPATSLNSVAHKYNSGRVLFRHTIHATGHGRGPNLFNSRTSQIVRQHMHADNPSRVAVLGHIVSIQGRDIVMRQLPWSARGLRGGTIKYKDTSGPVGKQGVLVDVRLTARTMVQDAYGLTGLHQGMSIAVGGSLHNHVVSAIFIADMGRTVSVRTRGFGVFYALSGRRVKLPAHRSLPTVLPQRHNHALDTSTTLHFEGGFGGPSFNYNTDLNIPLLDILAASVTLTKFSFVASLDGWTYNWPFLFTGTATSPLTMTQPGSVNLNVQPQAGGTGTYSDTFSGGLGFNIGITVDIYTAVGCGDFPYLDSCNFTKPVNLGLLSMINKTQDKAPMSGQDLTAPAVECPGIGIGIPDTPINAAEIDICSSFTFHGANFGGHVVAASGATMSPVDLSFDGTTADPVTITPTTATPDLTMSQFSWVPNLDYGLFARFKVLTIPVYDTPSIPVTSGPFPMIADAATRSAAGFNNLSGEPAQPTSTDFLFTAQKAVTNITYNWPASGDYNDASTVSATLTDNLGTPVTNKTLTFVLNGSSTETCLAITNASGVASCAITPTDVPAAGSLAISFAGDDQFVSSSASPTFTITKEESAVHWTTSTNTQNYHDSAPLTATLTEDAAGPAIASQTLSFALGTQSCSPQPTTDSTGAAGCTIASLSQVPASYTASASFAGNSYYLSSSDSHSYDITHEETTLTYTGDPFIANNRPATLKAILKEDGSVAPVPAGQTVTLTLGSGPGAQTCSSTTLADGTVSCLIPLVNQPLGNNPVSAVFAGDAYYVSSSDTSHQRLVFAFLPGGGAFTLGNCTAFTTTCSTSSSSATLTWWSSQWWKVNSLSGGSAPSSFKGFAAVASGGDPACGGSWTTGGGNSPPPPTAVPSYTAMVVSSTISQSGSIISGNIPEIVIVHTNPGYGPAPSLVGTGTIVGVLCHS